MARSDLDQRVNALAGPLSEYEADLRFALGYLDPDPASSLTKSRKVLEHLLTRLFEAEMQRPPRKPLLADMLGDNQFTRRLEDRIVCRMKGMRDLANMGPHWASVTAVDAERVLEDLCVVLEWYLQRAPAAPPGEPSSDERPAARPGASRGDVRERNRRRPDHGDTAGRADRLAPLSVSCLLAHGCYQEGWRPVQPGVPVDSHSSLRAVIKADARCCVLLLIAAFDRRDRCFDLTAFGPAGEITTQTDPATLMVSAPGQWCRWPANQILRESQPLLCSRWGVGLFAQAEVPRDLITLLVDRPNALASVDPAAFASWHERVHRRLMAAPTVAAPAPAAIPVEVSAGLGLESGLGGPVHGTRLEGRGAFVHWMDVAFERHGSVDKATV